MVQKKCSSHCKEDFRKGIFHGPRISLTAKGDCATHLQWRRLARADFLSMGASWMEGGETFSYVMAEDAWQMVYWLVDYLSWDDLGSIHFFDKVDQQYGILTSEEFEFCDRCKTVGEVADFLTKIASEGREKASPRKRESSLWRERVWWLFSMLCAFGFLWLVGCGIVKLVRWIAA